MTVYSWSSKYLTQRCFAVSSTNVWMFGLRCGGSVSCSAGRCGSSPHLGSFHISWSRPILKVVYVLLTLIPTVEGGFITSWHKITSWFCIQWHKILLVLVSQGSRALWAVLTHVMEGETGKVCYWPPMVWASFKKLAAPTCGLFMLKLVLCPDFLRMLNERGSTTVFLESLPNSCLFES